MRGKDRRENDPFALDRISYFPICGLPKESAGIPFLSSSAGSRRDTPSPRLRSMRQRGIPPRLETIEWARCGPPLQNREPLSVFAYDATFTGAVLRLRMPTPTSTACCWAISFGHNCASGSNRTAVKAADTGFTGILPKEFISLLHRIGVPYTEIRRMTPNRLPKEDVPPC